ncbi:hypothetical protein IF2G_09012 [Cordyceps javanica]|nr:hypothetical protein IF2G_09012 [Cordyceps javanica]
MGFGKKKTWGLSVHFWDLQAKPFCPSYGVTPTKMQDPQLESFPCSPFFDCFDMIQTIRNPHACRN